MSSSSAHPTIFTFTDVLRKVQAATYIKMRSMDNQAPIRRIEKDKICFLMEQYGLHTQINYLNLLIGT